MDSLVVHSSSSSPPPSWLPKPRRSSSLLHLHKNNIRTPFLTSISQRTNPFFLHLSYIISISLLGFLLLLYLPMKQPSTTSKPSHLDLLFTSFSANTVSSMTTVEMESFSNAQLILLTILMLLGGEVFTSMLPLLLLNHNHDIYNNKSKTISNNVQIDSNDHDHQLELIELGNSSSSSSSTTFSSSNSGSGSRLGSWPLNRYLGYVVLAYLVTIHASVCAFILGYLSLFPTFRALIESKGIKPNTFAIFTVVSSFANCGFIPTNENMIVFRSCSGLLLAICGLVLLGNTLYPAALRCLVWVLKVVTKRNEFELILANSDDDGADLGLDEYLMSSRAETAMLGATVAGFVVVQAALFSLMEWESEGLKGMNGYQKVVGSVFMGVSSRHSGETIVDLSIVSPAILVLFVRMMYLPPYTTFLPLSRRRERKSWKMNGRDNIGEEGGKETINNKKKKKKAGGLVESLIMSQLSYLVIFIIIICITERKQIYEDPLNFSVLNIVIEVISAYGNVGYTTGYSCKRQLKPNVECKDSWVGFSGKWSTKGKLTLIVVMVLGRLKKYNMNGGKAWLIR